MNVLVRQHEGTWYVDLPPDDFVPPPPEQWADVPDLRARCGRPMGEGVAGYGELEIVIVQSTMYGIDVRYCGLCWPMGPPVLD